MPAMVDASRRESRELVDMEAAATLHGLSRAEVLTHIEAGTITPRLITTADEPLFDGGMLRSWSRLAACDAAHASQRSGSEKNTLLAVADAAQRLKITHKTVFHMIENSFLGSRLVLFHSQNRTAAARVMAEKKVSGHRLYRVATCRQSLRLPNMISMRYRRLSYLTVFLREFRPGMQTFIPLSFKASLNQSASWPRSASSQSALGRLARSAAAPL